MRELTMFDNNCARHLRVALTDDVILITGYCRCGFCDAALSAAVLNRLLSLGSGGANEGYNGEDGKTHVYFSGG